VNSKSEKPHFKWKQRTPEQRVGRRAILRFEELTDELERDLRDIIASQESGKDLPAFNVSFVSADRLLNLDCSQGHNCTRYYNLRLLKTFRLTDSPDETYPIEPALHWIRNNKNLFEPLFRSADHLEKHSHNHFDRFCKALGAVDSLLNASTLKKPENRSESEKDADQAKVENAVAKVHDLLIEAIAAMPYKGLLPGALDHIFFTKGWQKPFTKPASFCLQFGKENELGRVWSADSDEKYKTKEDAYPLVKEAKELIPLEAFPCERRTDKDPAELGTLYIDQFINWFTLGLQPDANGADNPSPYKGANKDLKGLALPVYHFHSRNGEPVGGFEGWLVVIVDSETKETDLQSISQTLSTDGRSALLLASRSFSRRVREERMRELIEKEWTKHTTDPRSFTFEHFPEYDGWTVEKEFSAIVSKKEEHWLFAFLKNKDGIYHIYDKPPLSEEKASKQEKLSAFHDGREITHIAVWLPNLKGQAPRNQIPPLIFRKRDDTILPADHNDLVAYGFHITQSIHQIYESARLRHKVGETAGELLAQDLAHQIQHISVAISDRWMIPCTSWNRILHEVGEGRSAQLNSIIKTGYKVAPVPEIYDHVERILGLWTATKTEGLFPVNERIEQNICYLKEVLSKAASIAMSEWICSELKGITLDTSKGISHALARLRMAGKLNKMCSYENVEHIAVGKWNDSKRLINLVRLYQTIYFNAFRHATKPIDAKVKSKRPLSISLSNSSVTTPGAANRGERVIQNLAEAVQCRAEWKYENGIFIRSIQDIRQEP
jgi:hypothetical protein